MTYIFYPIYPSQLIPQPIFKEVFILYPNYIRFNLPSNLVPLMWTRKLIPIGKTSIFIKKKPIFR